MRFVGIGLLAVLSVATVVELPALTGFFHGDDLVALVAFGNTSIENVLSRLLGVFTWAPGERPHVVPVLQFWLGSRLFGGFYQAHVALLSGAHLSTTYCLYRLAERLAPLRVAAVRDDGLDGTNGADRLELRARLGVRKVRLWVDLGDADFFVQKLVPPPPALEFDAALVWSSKTGLSFEGQAALDLRIPLDTRIGPVELLDLLVALRADSTGTEFVAGVSATVALAFAVGIGPGQRVHAAADEEQIGRRLRGAGVE